MVWLWDRLIHFAQYPGKVVFSNKLGNYLARHKSLVYHTPFKDVKNVLSHGILVTLIVEFKSRHLLHWIASIFEINKGKQFKVKKHVSTFLITLSMIYYHTLYSNIYNKASQFFNQNAFFDSIAAINTRCCKSIRQFP